MKVRWALLLSAVIAASCSGGSGGGQQGSFRLLQFLEQGQDGIPRNRSLTFVFSQPVGGQQDFAERLKIQNVQAGANPNFSLALGIYETVGERVTFAPRLPNKEDRSDAGFRENGSYSVFLKGGPDALVSETGDPISTSQELLFKTSQYFEDPLSAEPPKVLGLFLADPTQPAAPRYDISRLDPRPGEQAILDNATLIDAVPSRSIDPGAGGLPQFGTPWRFELQVTEPIDPSTVTPDTIKLTEIYGGATTSGPDSPPFAPADHFGTPVAFPVPVMVSVEQIALDSGFDVRIVVQPLVTLVDNTRYRLTFGGSILGIDFRQQFIGANGLTGDGETVVAGATPYPEPGGLGYTAEFIVRDRPAITAKRTLAYDPVIDGVDPEVGQTTTDPAKYNTALYDPAQSPSTALGYLGAFGTGKDGSLAVSSGTVTIDTGDTPNGALGKPFQVGDLNPNDDYLNNTLPGGPRTYDSRIPFELHLQSVSIATGTTLRFIGVNPILLRVQGLTQISGTIDISGSDGTNGSGAVNATGGKAGPAGGDGGNSVRGGSCQYTGVYANCSNSPYTGALNSCGYGNWPYSRNGVGPGRGHAGGSAGGYVYFSPTTYGPTRATGGGGGSNGTKGTDGSDVQSAGATEGTAGGCYATTYYSVQNSSVVGVRGKAGTTYGDPTVADDTWGGSGGGAGGATQDYANFAVNGSGGAGGGAGGFLTVIGAGSIVATGGMIDATGGNGGAGVTLGWSSSPTQYHHSTAGGGAGSGGTVCFISGENIAATAAVLNTNGGTGGAAPTLQQGNCTNCNGGGTGGRGRIFLMDPDGLISGLFPNGAGTYPTFSGGFLTIATFATAGDRFGDTRAVTELFNIPAADPTYLELDSDTDVLAHVANGTQEIYVYASTAKADPDNPLLPDVTSEYPNNIMAPDGGVLIARVHYALGATAVETFGTMNQLNPPGPNAGRDAYIRINARFAYGNLVDAALGPFAYMDGMDISYSFNG